MSSSSNWEWKLFGNGILRQIQNTHYLVLLVWREHDAPPFFYSALSALKYKRLEFGKEFFYGIETARIEGRQLIFQDVSPNIILLPNKN